MNDLRKAICDMVSENIVKVVISNKMKSDVQYNKIVFLLKEKKGREYYQIERYTDKQVFHENIDKEKLEESLFENIESRYKQVNAWSENSTFDMKISKKGKVFLGKKSADNKKVANKSHNKEKNYILKEGMLIQPLIDLGVFTKEGQVVNSKYD